MKKKIKPPPTPPPSEGMPLEREDKYFDYFFWGSIIFIIGLSLFLIIISFLD